MSGNINGTGPRANYPDQYFELREEFKERPDQEYVKNAEAAVKAGRCAEAGTFVKSIKDEALRDETTETIIAMIQELYGANSEKAYDGLHQFLDNLL